MEERLRIQRVAANILNKQSHIAEKRMSSSLGVGRGAKKFSPQKLVLLRNGYNCLWPGRILW